MNLPPLPKPENEADSDGCTYACPEGYSADQMRAYGESCARMAREEAAKVCDNVAANYTKHYELGARECAAAIRKG